MASHRCVGGLSAWAVLCLAVAPVHGLRMEDPSLDVHNSTRPQSPEISTSSTLP